MESCARLKFFRGELRMDRLRLLRWYFWVGGFLNIFVISFTVPLLFGDLFLWHPRNIPDERMIQVSHCAR